MVDSRFNVCSSFVGLVAFIFLIGACSSTKPASPVDGSVDGDADTDTDTDSDTDTDTDTSLQCSQINPCSEHSTCIDTDGVIICECDVGYAGTYCYDCDTGYHASGGECVEDESCTPDPCLNGACDLIDGEAECDCEEGWAGDLCDVCAPGYHPDEVSDGGPDGGSVECVLDQECLPTSCANGGTCDDTTGEVVCDCVDNWDPATFCYTCESGYHLDGGVCLVDEVCDADSCNYHGDCSIVGGVVECSCTAANSVEPYCECAPGFNAHGTSCDISCASVGEEICGDHGDCVDATGPASCQCDTGYTGDYCNECFAGYHPSGTTCVPDESCTPNPCANGDCTLVGGEAECDCDYGWAGDACDTCAPGFHGDGSGGCELDQECTATSCANGCVCSVVGSTVTCDNGSTNWDESTFCYTCEAGYHETGGVCVVDETCTPDPCNGHGTCEVVEGEAVCTCTVENTTLPYCECVTNFNDHGATCDMSCTLWGMDCGGVDHGYCDDATGPAYCVCEDGYTGDNCQECDTGYHASGTSCVLDETCTPNPCANGDCSLSGGEAECDCDYGWAGDTCDTCAPGFHDDGGACVLDQECTPTSCANGCTCSVVGSTVICDNGATNWDESTFCYTCEAGYHESGGACVADEVCLADSCNYHGTCSIVGGAIDCSCTVPNSVEPYCECFPGYVDHGTSCDMSCTLWGVDCGDNGVCDDSIGPAECSCDTGWSGSYCETCQDDGLENNDSDDSADAITLPFNSNLVICELDEDWFQVNLIAGDELTVTVSYTYSTYGDIDLFLYKDYQSTGNLIDYSETTTDTEQVVHLVPVGESGTYLIRIKPFPPFNRNTYSISVSKTTTTCYDCASLGVTCGVWDDGCAGTVDCTTGSCDGSGDYCEQHVDDGNGTCAQYFDDLVYGCCDGDNLNFAKAAPGTTIDCASYGLECGYMEDTYYTGQTGFFYCAVPGDLSTPPPNLASTCPSGMTWM